MIAPRRAATTASASSPAGRSPKTRGGSGSGSGVGVPASEAARSTRAAPSTQTEQMATPGPATLASTSQRSRSQKAHRWDCISSRIGRVCSIPTVTVGPSSSAGSLRMRRFSFSHDLISSTSSLTSATICRPRQPSTSRTPSIRCALVIERSPSFSASRSANSIAFLASCVKGMAAPWALCGVVRCSTSARTRSMVRPKGSSASATTPPWWITASSRCSVPIQLWSRRRASSCASTTTRRASSVNRSNTAGSVPQPPPCVLSGDAESGIGAWGWLSYAARVTVYLVGAGPGDPGLVTVRGAELLARADVVVHDRLSAAELLDLAPPGAERIDVGKAPGRHTMRQEDICALLVDRGRAGQTVVRLKGGDPFVFARGGEEAAALAEAGVAYEVVPGITSALAVPGIRGHPGDAALLVDVVHGRDRPRGPGLDHHRRLGRRRPGGRHPRDPDGGGPLAGHQQAAGPGRARPVDPGRGGPVGHPARPAHGAGDARRRWRTTTSRPRR